MALSSYDLPSIVSVVGTYEVRIYSDVAGLTAPTVDTVLSIGDKEETIDAALNFSTYSTLNMLIRDDYSVTAEGFWYALFQGATCYVRIKLNSSHFFIGRPFQPEALRWNEVSLFSGSIRVASLTLTDAMPSMMETETGSWITAIKANEIATGVTDDNTPNTYMTLKGLFSDLLVGSALNASFDEADVDLVFDASNPDFVFLVTAAEYDMSDLRLIIKTNQTAVSAYYTAYYDSTNAAYWPDNFANVGALLPYILRNYGLALRMDYDASTETATAMGTHRIQLIQRGRAYADSANLAFSNREKTSSITKANEMIGDAVKFTQAFVDTNFVWQSKKFRRTTPQTIAPPSYIKFDIDTLTVFGEQSSANYSPFPLWILDGTWQKITAVKFWNYQSGAYVTNTVASGKRMEEALCGYSFYRFTYEYSKITRLYGHMTAGRDDDSTETFTNLTIGRRVSINDGTGAAQFFANRVILKPMTSEVEIEWFKE